jgi:hypothetical protein
LLRHFNISYRTGLFTDQQRLHLFLASTVAQSFSNLLLAQRLPTIKKFTKIANVYCERV